MEDRRISQAVRLSNLCPVLLPPPLLKAVTFTDFVLLPGEVFWGRRDLIPEFTSVVG